MSRAILPLILVGPATCKGCRALVWWRGARWGAWFGVDGKEHVCAAGKAA